MSKEYNMAHQDTPSVRIVIAHMKTIQISLHISYYG